MVQHGHVRHERKQRFSRIQPALISHTHVFRIAVTATIITTITTTTTAAAAAADATANLAAVITIAITSTVVGGTDALGGPERRQHHPREGL